MQNNKAIGTGICLATLLFLASGCVQTKNREIRCRRQSAGLG